jgi:type IV pilus assembly protein PilP
VKRSSFKWQSLAAVAVCAWLWLGGCGGGEQPPAPKPPASPKPAAKAAPPAATKPATPSSAQAVPLSQAATAPPPSTELQPPSYTYVSGNRRDPFRSIIVAKSKQASMNLVHPLQQYAVKDLRLVAVLWGQLGAGAMLQAPDGKGYTVYVGTAVGNRDGVVKQIKPDQIVIKERYTDIFGERKEDSVVLDLHLPEEGLK